MSFIFFFNFIVADDSSVLVKLHLDSDDGGVFFAYSVRKTELRKNINVPALLKRIKEGTIKKEDRYIDEKVVNYDNIILCGATHLDVYESIELSEDRNILYTSKVMDKIHGLIDMYFLTNDLYNNLMSLTIENIGFNLHNSSFEEGSKKSYKLNKKLGEILKGGFLTGSLVTCIKIALKKDKGVIDFLNRSKDETGATSEYHLVNAFTADRGDDPCDIFCRLRHGTMQYGSKFDFSFYFEYMIKANVMYYPPSGFQLRQRDTNPVNSGGDIYREATKSNFGDDIKFYEQINVTFRKSQNSVAAIRSVLNDSVSNEIRVEELDNRRIEDIDFTMEFKDVYTLNVYCDPRSELVESYVLNVRIDPDKTMGVDNGDFKRSCGDVQICVSPEDIKTENDFKNFISRHEFNGRRIPVDKILNVFESKWDNDKWKDVSVGAFSKDLLKDWSNFNIALDKKYAVDEGFIIGGVEGDKEGKISNTETSNLGNNHLKPISGPSCCACCGKCCTYCGK